MPNEIVSEDHPVSMDKGLVARFLSVKSLIGRGNFVEKRSLAEEVVERQTMPLCKRIAMGLALEFGRKTLVRQDVLLAERSWLEGQNPE